LTLIKAITRGCRTKAGESLIELQILNGASPIKFNQDTDVCSKKESGNAIALHYYILREV